MKKLLLAVLGMAFVACHGGGGAAQGTVRAACEEIGMALCDRVDACHLQTNGNCFDTFMNGCCTGATCDQHENAPQSAVDQCRNDVVAESCTDIGNGDIPQSCTQI